MDNTEASISRRTALKTVAATLLTANLTHSVLAEPGVTPPATGATASATKPTMHVYQDYSWLRGFSVVPSWGARIEDAWWDYDGSRMREEVRLAPKVHANCIRLWIEFTAWMADPDKVTHNFMDAIAAIDEAGMKTMPCLFNRWHDSSWDYGGTYTETLFRNWQPQLAYVKELVTPLINDERILIWDLCNEPQAHDQTSDVNKKEFQWLSDIAKTVRKCGAKQPITIGTMNGKNIETYAPLMDVLCSHPYAHTPEKLDDMIKTYHQLSATFQKPLLVNECIPGSLNDATRGEVARFYTEKLSTAGFGWMGWALREGKAISTRRDRYDGNGINKEGFHPFFTKEGQLRTGLEFLTEKPKLRAPWEKV
jgi:hypothetical protein